MELIIGDEFYAGIGSRETPDVILSLMRLIASKLELDGMILRSGGADGADRAFESGVIDPLRKAIYLPWKGFSGRSDEDIGCICKYSDEHEIIAKENHHAWYRLGRGGKALQTRNVAQVLGDDCKSKSMFVVCWTKNGSATGGTGQAIRIARKNDIPVLNLYNYETRQIFENYLSTGELVYV